MNQYERDDAKRVGRVIRAARKLSGINQSQISKDLGITQATFSNIEKGNVAISGSLWFRLSKILGLSSQHSFVSGVIDNTDFSEEPSKTGIKIPKMYFHNAESTIRTSQPFFKFFESKLGEDLLEEFLSTRLDIDPDVRFIYNLRLSIRFNCDIAVYLIQKGYLKMDNLEELTRYLRVPNTHGKIAQCYERASTKIDLLKKLCQNISLYEKNFSYSIVSESPNSLEIESKPAHFMRYFSYKEDQLSNFLNLYRASFIQSFSTYLWPESTPANVKIIPSDTKRKTECIFRVTI